MIPTFSYLGLPAAGNRYERKDVIVYGATNAGCHAAFMLRRTGMSVTIIAGEEETLPDGTPVPGGMTTSSLTNTDEYRRDLWYGEYLETWKRVWAILGLKESQSRWVRGSIWRAVLEERCAEMGINLLGSRGIDALNKEGGRITGIRTRDGLHAFGRYFVCANDMGDLMAFAGVPFEMHRNAISEYNEANAGIRYNSGRQIQSADNGWPYQQTTNLSVPVDPWIVPGAPSSGKLWGLVDRPTVPLGSRWEKDQSRNYRIQMINVSSGDDTFRRDLMTTAPTFDGQPFDPARHETTLRFFQGITDSGQTMALSDTVIVGSLDGVLYDINNRAMFSTDVPILYEDYLNAGFDYAAGIGIDYDARRATRNRLRDHNLGHWWVLQSLDDSRVPETLRTSARKLWLVGSEWENTWDPGDPKGFPGMPYNRSTRRAIGPDMVTANDMVAADGACRYADQVIGQVNYELDSHGLDYVPLEYAPGYWTVQALGGSFQGLPGDGLAPLPVWMLEPPQGIADNLLLPVSGRRSSLADATFRMEPIRGMTGQAAGLWIAMLAEGNADLPVHAINVQELRQELRLRGATVDIS